MASPQAKNGEEHETYAQNSKPGFKNPKHQNLSSKEKGGEDRCFYCKKLGHTKRLGHPSDKILSIFFLFSFRGGKKGKKISSCSGAFDGVR